MYYSRYADRARLIKNKPILNRADPKDAELAKLRVLVAQLQARLTNGSSCFPLLSPCPKTIIKPLSATTINNNSTNSQFSSELVTNLMNKNKKLEVSKLYLIVILTKFCDYYFQFLHHEPRTIIIKCSRSLVH